MNKCRNYDMPCLYALKAWDELPCCVPNEEACDKWREKYKRETQNMSKEELAELEKKLLK